MPDRPSFCRLLLSASGLSTNSRSFLCVERRWPASQVRLQLFILAYNLGNFMRRLTLPESVKHWSLRSVQIKLIKMGGRLVRHARRLVFQLAEVAVPREVFRQVLESISGLHQAPG
ncbi:MAG: transposase [Dehalococcoidia bacterium]